MRRQTRDVYIVLLLVAVLAVIWVCVVLPRMRKQGWSGDLETSIETESAPSGVRHENDNAEPDKSKMDKSALDKPVFEDPKKPEKETKDGSSESWEMPQVPEHLQNAPWDSEELIEHIRENWILHPDVGAESHMFANDKHRSQERQSEIVDELLKQEPDGVFVECGAGDGVMLSDTIFFEKMRGWSGLLIEPDPVLFASLLTKKRNAMVTNACASPYDHARVLEFTQVNNSMMGGLSGHMEDSHFDKIKHRGTRTITVQCFPLASLLIAAGIHEVDYLSLDVEGAEFEILKTFPFGAIDIDILSVEYFIIGHKQETENKVKKIRKLMIEQRGYEEVQTTDRLDIILRKKVRDLV